MTWVVLLAAAAACGGGAGAEASAEAGEHAEAESYTAADYAAGENWEPGEMLTRDLVVKWREAAQIAWQEAGGDPAHVFTPEGGMNSTPEPLNVLTIGQESGIDLTIFSNVQRMVYTFLIAPRFVGDAATEDIHEKVREHNERFVAENRDFILGELAKVGYTGG